MSKHDTCLPPIIISPATRISSTGSGGISGTSRLSASAKTQQFAIAFSKFSLATSVAFRWLSSTAKHAHRQHRTPSASALLTVQGGASSRSP